MHNKVKKCLESMGYTFFECERVELNTGFILSNGFRLDKPYKEVYIEMADNGDINIWDYKSGSLEYIIINEALYVMMFGLACILNN